MTDTELLKLRRQVRRDDQITDSAARLFCEVVDLAMLDDGCTAGPTQLGAWLGMSTRTVRRRRDELIDAGYLRVEPHENGRKLVPCKTDGQECRTGVADNSGQTSEVADKIGQDGVDKSGQHKENNNTHERGRAPADDSGDKQSQAESGSTLDRYIDEDDPVELYAMATSRRPPGVLAADEIKQTIDDLPRWRGVLKEWVGKGHKKTNIEGMLDVYRDGWRDGRKVRPIPDPYEHDDNEQTTTEDLDAMIDYEVTEDDLDGTNELKENNILY